MVQWGTVNAFTYTTFHTDHKTHARTGCIHTPHGNINTPAFVPVGTQASVKSLTPHELSTLEVSLFFVNTYHMYLRPGLDVVKKAGGLHRFMGWDGPIITDSGGFQVFSLGRKKFKDSKQSVISSQTDGEGDDAPSLVRITDDGVRFRSHWDGSEHMFTPERSMQYQWTLGSDIHIAFDDCTSYPVTEKEAKLSMERTHRWAKRSLEEHGKIKNQKFPLRQGLEGQAKIKNTHSAGSEQANQKLNTVYQPYQALYGSIQGSVYENLRKESAEYISSLPFDGFAIGGVAVGESKEEMKNVLDWVTPFLPDDKPRHLLGVGEIDDIFTLVEHGMDTFDCVQPTRLARMGRVYTKFTNQTNLTNPTNEKMYEIDIMKAGYAGDMDPIEKRCPCYTCTHFSRSYIHHLFKVRELLGYRLATIHNIAFINRLVGEIRLAIGQDSFVALKKQWLHG